MIRISNNKLIEIVDTMNYARDLISIREPNEIIDNLDDSIAFLDNLVILDNDDLRM